MYFVHDNSLHEEFKVDFSHYCSSTCGCGQFQENDYPCVHTLFVLHQKNMLDDILKSSMDEGYFRKKVAKTCLSLSVEWMNKLQGVEGVDKCELVEESQKEEYILYVYDLWRKASTLSHRLYSCGEQDTNKFLGRKESKKTNHVESRLGNVKNTAKMNGLI